MPVEAGVFADCFDGAGPLARIGHVANHLCQAKGISHEFASTILLTRCAGAGVGRPAPNGGLWRSMGGQSTADKERVLTGLEIALAVQLARSLMNGEFPLLPSNRHLTGIQTLLGL